MGADFLFETRRGGHIRRATRVRQVMVVALKLGLRLSVKLVLGLKWDLTCYWKPSTEKPRCSTRRPSTAGGNGGRSLPIPGIHFLRCFILKKRQSRP